MNNTPENTVNGIITVTDKAIETRVSKGRDGWKAESKVYIEETDGCTCISVSTWKANKGLSSYFQFGNNKDADGYTSFSFIMFQDRSGILCTSPKRCTEKSVTALHDLALRRLTTLILEGKEIAPSDYSVII